MGTADWKPAAGWVVVEVLLDPLGGQPTNRGRVLAVGGSKGGPCVGDEAAFKEATLVEPSRRIVAVTLDNVVAWRVMPPEPVIVAPRTRPVAAVANGDGGE